jgi:hypothetical protein
VVVWDAQTGHELLVFTLPAGVRAHGAHFFGRGIECFAVPSRLIWLASDWVDQHPDAEKKP